MAECEMCGEPCRIIESQDGKQKPYCANCDVWGSAGATEYDTALTSDSYDNSGTSYAHSGEGAKPEGFRNYNNKNKLSDGRKAGLRTIQMLCAQYNIQGMALKEMESLMRDKNLKANNFDVTAYAIFRYISIQHHQAISASVTKLAALANPQFSELEVPKRNKKGRKMNLGEKKEEAEKTGTLITAKNIYLALKNVQKYVLKNKPELLDPDLEPTTEAANAMPRYEMPPVSSNLVCPFNPKEDVTPRVTKLTKQVLEVVYRRCGRSTHVIFMPLAAGHLSYQSCFFLRSLEKANFQPGIKAYQRSPGLEEYLKLIKYEYNPSQLSSIRRNAAIMRKELIKLFKVMKWIKPERIEGKFETSRAVIRRYLDEILRFSNWSIEYLNKKKEAKRLAQPFDEPPPPRELTDEERAALDSPELSSKDLTEAELHEYIRSSAEVKQEMQDSDWMEALSDSNDDSDDEMDEEE